MILFGSGLAGQFVIETVFVIAEARPMSAAIVDELKAIDGVFETVVLDLLYRDDKDHRRHRLYGGATPASPVGRMFSFFPCLPLSEAPRGFPRPSVRLDGFINPNNWRNYKLTKAQSLEEVEKLWLRIVRQVLEQGLRLGVHAAIPTKVPREYRTPESIDPSAGGCNSGGSTKWSAGRGKKKAC